MIKVCHLTSSHNSNDVRIFQKECKSLKEAGFEVYLVARGDSREDSNVHVIGVGSVAAGRFNRFFRASKSVYNAAVSLNADIYHFHDPELIPYGIKLAKSGKIVIFDSHEDYVALTYDREYIPNFIRPFARWAIKRYLAYAARIFSAVIVTTPRLIREYSQYNKNTIQVANYPVYKEAIYKKRERAAVFAGGITDSWNHQRVISAVGSIQDCRYYLCGPCKEGYLNDLKSNPAWSCVDYLGKVPFEDVADIMAKSSIGIALLLPSYNSGGMEGSMGNTKIFEEMMAGLPVVCTKFALWEEFVNRYKCGICVDPNSTDEIRNAIEWLLDHPEDANVMGKNGVKAVKEEFNWGVESKRLVALYNKLCGRVKQ